MRILLISHTCQSATEGQPKAEHLSRIPGIELCVLVPDRWNHYGTLRYADPQKPGTNYKLVVGKVRCHWLGPAQYYLHWYPGLAGLIKSFRPDIIDLWEEPWGLVSAQACRLRNRLAPDTMIISESEQNIEKRLPPPFEQLRSYTLANADWVIGRSDDAVDVMRAKGYVGPSSVVPNAVDTGIFRPLDKKKCRTQLVLNGFVVGYFGRLVSQKGVEDLIAALELCPPSVSLLLAGDGSLFPELKRSVEIRGLADRVHFLGEISPKDLSIAMNAVDVVVLPSRSTPKWKEQFGRVIIEAQACSVPVIGTKSGAIPKVVGRGGLLVEENSPSGLAEAILALRADPDLVRELGAAGLAQVQSAYTWETVARTMADTYEKTLGRELSAAPPKVEIRSMPAFSTASAK